MITESRSGLDTKEHRKFGTSISITHIAFFILIFSFILIVWGFYSTEMILWNRLPYSDGQWANDNPIHLTTELDNLNSMLKSSINLISIGIVSMIIISFILIVYYFVLLLLGRNNDKWTSQYRASFIFLAISSGIISILGQFFTHAITLIGELPSRNGEITGSEWLNIQIPKRTEALKSIGENMFLIFFFILVISILILYLQKAKKEEIITYKSEKPKSNIIFRFFSSFKRLLANFIINFQIYVILLFYLAITLIPVLITLIISITSKEMFNDPIQGFFFNYSSLLFALSSNEPAFASAFLISIILGTGTAVFGLSVSLSAGYALARFKFSGNKLFTFLILSTQMFPGLILLIPQFVLWKSLGLLREEALLFGVLLAYVSGAVAYCTWMMKGYFETIPIDLEEAAQIDGAGQLSTFLKIALPLSKPGMVAVSIFTFLTAWSEFVLARSFIGEGSPVATLPLLFYNYQNMGAPDNPIFFELLAPYAIIVALPMIIFFMLLQKQLASGVVAGGIK